MIGLIITASLALVPIEADDPRLANGKTFISPDAESALAHPRGERVLCLERQRNRTVCLTETQWVKALRLRSKQNRFGPLASVD